MREREGEMKKRKRNGQRRRQKRHKDRDRKKKTKTKTEPECEDPGKDGGEYKSVGHHGAEHEDQADQHPQREGCHSLHSFC